MSRAQTLQKLRAYKAKPDLFQPLSPNELADLVVVVLSQVDAIERAISEGRLDGYTPQPDKDYLAKSTAVAFLTEAINAKVAQYDVDMRKKGSALDDQVNQAIQRIRDGKDGIVSEAEIARAAAIAFSMIELPDVEALVTTALTTNNTATRDGLELLNGDERLSMDAIRNLNETIEALRAQIQTGGGSGGGGMAPGHVIRIINRAIADGTISVGGSGHTIEDEGTPLTARTSLNFVGAGVSVADTGGKTVVTIPSVTGLEGYFNIKDYGALVDGTTDDTVAIQATIDAVEAAGGGVVWHPGGTAIAQTLTVSLTKGVTFAGTGWDAEYKLKTGTNDHLIEFADNVAGMWVNFENVKFHGNAPNQTAGNIIQAEHAIECRFTNVWFTEPYDWAVFLKGRTASGAFGHHNNFINCLFDNGNQSAGQGGAIKTDDNDENTAIGCEFQYMGGSGSSYNCAILDNSGLNNWSHNTFVDARSGIYILDASQTRVQSNMFDRVQYDNLFIKGHANIVTGNVFYEIGGNRVGTGVASGVKVDYYGQNIVSHNVFKASPTNDRTRSFIHDMGGGAGGYNQYIGNKIKDDGGTTSDLDWDIESTPNVRHSNDGDDTHQVILADDSEESIIGGGGGITRTVASIATNTTAGSTATTDYVYFVTATATLTLPTAIGNTNRYTVKSVAGTTTVACNGAQTIDGVTTIVIQVEDSVDLISNGTEWKVV